MIAIAVVTDFRILRGGGSADSLSRLAYTGFDAALTGLKVVGLLLSIRGSHSKEAKASN